MISSRKITDLKKGAWGWEGVGRGGGRFCQNAQLLEPLWVRFAALIALSGGRACLGELG